MSLEDELREQLREGARPVMLPVILVPGKVADDCGSRFLIEFSAANGRPVYVEPGESEHHGGKLYFGEPS